MRFLLFLLVWLSSSVSIGMVFPNFDKFYENSLKKNEFLDIKLKSLVSPNFDSYFCDYSKDQKGLLNKIMNLGIKKNIFNSKKELKKLLINLLEDSINKDTQKSSVDLRAVEDDRFYIWGDLYGAYHSFLRSLKCLKENHVIDNNFKILTPKTFFIINGNAIGFSAYNIETLLIILILKHQNPNNVIYLKGNQEDNKNWMDNNFNRQLEKCFKKNNFKETQLFSNVKSFLNLLPLRLNIYTEVDKNNFVLFSHNLGKINNGDLDIEVNDNDQSTQGKPIVIFSSTDRLTKYSKPSGLELRPQEMAAIVWHQFSGLVPSFYQLYQYNIDSFSCLKLNNDLHKSVIEHFSHPFNSAQKFHLDTYKLLSGEKINPQENIDKIIPQEINIATTIDFSNGAAILGERLMKGLDLKIRKSNKDKSVHPKIIRNFYENDEYNPSNTLKFLQGYFKKNDISILLSPLGTPTATAIKNYAKNENIAILFPYTGSLSFRYDGPFLHYRASYADEAETVVKYACDKLFKQKFAFFYQNDDFGNSLLSAARKILIEHYKISEDAIIEAPYSRNSLSVANAAQKIREGNVDVLFFFSTYAHSRELVNHMGVIELQNITLMGISFLTDRFRDYVSGIDDPKLEGKGLNLILSRVVPDPETDDREIVKEYRSEMQKEYSGIRMDADSLEGYINASIFVEILDKIEGPITPQKILEYGKSLKNFNFKGLNLNYDAKRFCFSNEIWLDLGKDKWIQNIIPTP
ncbi:MAG: ABC transporter substrate-binding protein [Alphaproteobacteria bacterium]|nr:ABC transporter substrate-binding protein [Alphaproteobacteria bacterium]